MKVGSLCKRAVITIDTNQTLRAAAVAMLSQHVGALVVTVESNGRRDAIGVVTDRDLMIAAVAHELEPSEVLVGAVANRQIVAIRETASAAQAASMLRSAGVRRLLVIDVDGEVAGFLSSDDLLAALIEPLEELAGAYRAGIAREEELSEAVCMVVSPPVFYPMH